MRAKSLLGGLSPNNNNNNDTSSSSSSAAAAASARKMQQITEESMLKNIELQAVNTALNDEVDRLREAVQRLSDELRMAQQPTWMRSGDVVTASSAAAAVLSPRRVKEKSHAETQVEKLVEMEKSQVGMKEKEKEKSHAESHVENDKEKDKDKDREDNEKSHAETQAMSADAEEEMPLKEEEVVERDVFSAHVDDEQDLASLM